MDGQAHLYASQYGAPSNPQPRTGSRGRGRDRTQVILFSALGYLMGLLWLITTTQVELMSWSAFRRIKDRQIFGKTATGEVDVEWNRGEEDGEQ